MKKFCSISLILIALLISIPATQAFALSPPTEEMIAEMIEDGTYEQQIREAYATENHIMSPGLVEKAQTLGNDTPIPTPTPTDGQSPPQSPRNPTLSSIGNQKVLVILIDFPNYPSAPWQTVQYEENNMFGAENISSPLYPYESLSAYYKRSSYDLLNISGEVWGWYRAPMPSYYYTDHTAGDKLIKDAINYYISQGNDITKFDNDNDGTIDAVYVKWTAPSGAWSSFWWAKQTGYGINTDLFQNKKLSTYVWMPFATTPDAGASVDIHEFGHVLGLPDYYDYDPAVPPSYALGGYDIMDGNRGDHCAFSKFVLGWLEPMVIATGGDTTYLRSTSEFPDALVLMPQATLNACKEYYILQFRRNEKNDRDTSYLNGGLQIWHVDATLDQYGGYFINNNSNSDHKLISLLQPGVAQSKFGDYFTYPPNIFFRNGDVFNDTSIPNSNKWDGSATNISVSNIYLQGIYAQLDAFVNNSDPIRIIQTSYDYDSNEFKFTFNGIRGSVFNNGGIQLTSKSGENILGEMTAGNNWVAFKSTIPIQPDSKYNISFPAGAVLDYPRGNPSAAYSDTIITDPVRVYRDSKLQFMFLRFKDQNGEINCIKNDTRHVYVEVGIANYFPETRTVSPVIAVYENDKLVQAQVLTPLVIHQNDAGFIYTNLQPITLPPGAENTHKIKVFLFDNLDNITPLTNALVLN